MADGQLRSAINQLRRLLGRQSSSALTEAQLLEDFVSRQDEASFEVLVWRHGTMVLSVCQRILRDTHEAEDAFQATFLVFARKAGSIGKRESVASWLYKVAYRVALRLRARSVKRSEREEPIDDLPAPEAGDDTDWHDLRPVLDEEIDRLPEKYRAPFVLCYLQGHTNEEAAEQLGCPKGTILSRLARGRERLRSRLAQRGVALSAACLTTTLVQNASAAAVSPVLVSSTTKAALPFAAGQAVTGLVSPSVIALTQGVLHTMLLSKIKSATAAVLALTILGTGIGSVAYWAQAQRPTDRPQPVAERTSDPTDTRIARDEVKAEVVTGRVVAVAKDGKSITLEVPPPGPANRGEERPEPKKVEIKLGDKTVVAYQAVGPNGAKPTEGYGAQVRLEKGSKDLAASVTFHGGSPAGRNPPDVAGKVTAIAQGGKGLTIEVSPARGRGDDAQEAKTLEVQFTDKTLVVFSAVAKGDAKLTEGYEARVWLADGPKGSTASSVHLSGKSDTDRADRRGDDSNAAGKVVTVAKDGKTITVELRPENRGDEPRKVDFKLNDKTAITYHNVGADGTKLAEGMQARIWLEQGSKDTAGKLALTGTVKERWSFVTGKVVGVANDGKAITLEQLAAERGAEPKKVEIKVTDKTRMAFYGVGPDEAKPADGQQARARVDDDAPSIAVEIMFSKPGAAGERGR